MENMNEKKILLTLNEIEQKIINNDKISEVEINYLLHSLSLYDNLQLKLKKKLDCILSLINETVRIKINNENKNYNFEEINFLLLSNKKNFMLNKYQEFN